MYRLLVIVALAVLLVPAPEAARAATPQLRAFWVDAFHEGIKKPEHTRRLIADAERAGANAVIVQIRRRGDSYYRNSIEPIAADVAEGYDPLADLIAQAHERGIQVHAWVAALPAWKDGYPQPDRSHVWYQHGPDKPGWENWFTRDIDGRAGECAAQGDCGYYLDPGHPEVLDYTVRVVTHLASRYAIDGLHLDYIRYASPRYGYNPASLARFQVASGRSDVPQPEDAQWMQWRRDQVTKLVKRIYLSLNVVRPEAVLSVAAIAWGGAPPNGDFTQSSPYRRVMQDWKGWLDAGYIDLAIPMIYDKQDGGQQQGWYEGWVDYVAQNQGRRVAAVGVGAWLNNADGNLQQIRRGAAAGIGTALYSYAVPVDGDRAAFLDRLRNEAWSDGAAAPGYAWKQQPERGHILGLVAKDGAGLDGVSVRIECAAEHCPINTTTDAAGWFGAVDVPPGSYTAVVKSPADGTDLAFGFGVEAGRVARFAVPLTQDDPAADWAGADGDSAFGSLWERTDGPVARGETARSWTWGPSTYATGSERYAEAPDGRRLVQYWDKSRMEIGDPNADRAQLWFVTNGLLTKELISGRAQVGNSAFVERQPAEVPVAGDPDDSNSPTYASFGPHASLDADRRVDSAVGATVAQSIARDGTLGFDAELGRYGVTIGQYNNELGHNIPNVFNDFFGVLPVDWVFALGYPISEPFWATVQVGGEPKDVLMQVFERRVLTYTPSNPDGFKVEMGNVGQHYWLWRYGTTPWK